MLKKDDYILDGTTETGSHWNVELGCIDGKPILLVDFDHTITTKCLGCWNGNVGCKVQDGAREALEELSKTFLIYIYTGDYRYIDPNAVLMKTVAQIEELLVFNKIPFDKVLQCKPPAMFIIDDRALHHTSWTNTMNEIKRRCAMK